MDAVVSQTLQRSVDPLTPEFALLHRGRRLNCTEVAAVLQADPWLSRVRVFQRKLHAATCLVEREKRALPEAARWGIEHEAEALREYAARTRSQPQRCGFVTHPRHPWLGGVPDALLAGLVVEVKCPTGPPGAHPLPPPWHEPQLQCLMQCCGVPACHYVEYRPGQPLRVVTVLRDDAWFAAALPVLERFWEDVEAHRGPRVLRLW